MKEKVAEQEKQLAMIPIDHRLLYITCLSTIIALPDCNIFKQLMIMRKSGSELSFSLQGCGQLYSTYRLSDWNTDEQLMVRIR